MTGTMAESLVSEPSKIWQLNEALELIRALQPGTRKYGYHLCLGGSVLNKGMSKKDLDLYFLSLDNSAKPNPVGLRIWLKELWGEGEPLAGVRLNQDNDPAYSIDEHSPYEDKLKYNYGGLRIDVFIMGGEREGDSGMVAPAMGVPQPIVGEWRAAATPAPPGVILVEPELPPQGGYLVQPREHLLIGNRNVDQAYQDLLNEERPFWEADVPPLPLDGRGNR